MWTTFSNPRSPLRKKSRKARRENAARAECIAIVKERAGNRCQFPCCTEPGIDCHEVLPRSAGGSTTDPDNCRWLCRHHHDWLHNHPSASQRMGFKVSRYAAAQPSPTTLTGEK